MPDNDTQKQNREKWSGRIDPALLNLAKRKAVDLERSQAYIIELALREMFKNELPPGWKPGKGI